MSVLEQNTTKKKQINKNNTIKLNTNKYSREYKVKAVCNGVVYTKESTSYLLRFYYLVF